MGFLEMKSKQEDRKEELRMIRLPATKHQVGSMGDKSLGASRISCFVVRRPAYDLDCDGASVMRFKKVPVDGLVAVWHRDETGGDDYDGDDDDDDDGRS